MFLEVVFAVPRENREHVTWLVSVLRPQTVRGMRDVGVLIGSVRVNMFVMLTGATGLQA